MSTSIKNGLIFFLTLLIISVQPQNIFCQVNSIDTVYVTTKKFDTSKYWDSKPLSELPKHIPIYKDIMYLYADYENIANNTIPVYIVNNTANRFEYDGYSGILLQQEFKDADSIWRRSKSYYHFSSCRPFIGQYEIRPYEFTLDEDLILNEGEEYEVRYRYFNTDIVTSNIGKAKINLEDAEVARFDDIAFRTSGADFLIKIIRGELAPFDTQEKNDELIGKAIIELSFYYPDEAIPVLSVLAKDYANKFCALATVNLESIKKKKQKK